MNPTHLTSRFKARSPDLIRVACALLCLLCIPALAADNRMPRPPELEHDVQFWIRVYSQVDTNSGFIHDEQNWPSSTKRCTLPQTLRRTSGRRLLRPRVIITWRLCGASQEPLAR